MALAIKSYLMEYIIKKDNQINIFKYNCHWNYRSNYLGTDIRKKSLFF
jgi:hypothetical protein